MKAYNALALAAVDDSNRADARRVAFPGETVGKNGCHIITTIITHTTHTTHTTLKNMACFVLKWAKQAISITLVCLVCLV